MTRNVVTGSAGGGGGGASLTPSSGNFASGSFGSGLIQVYGVGSHTFTVPTGVTQIRARAWGGGASGGGSFCMKIITGLESGSSIAITVGEGALDNASAGSSSVGSYMTAGGASSSAGGTAAGGDVNYSGGNGGSTTSYGGGGAASMFGPGNSISGSTRGGAVGGHYTTTTTGRSLPGTGRGLSGGTFNSVGGGTDAYNNSFVTLDVPSLTSIDLIGTGIGGSVYGMDGANGGGGSSQAVGGFPGGGGGAAGADGLVIVEW